MSAQSEPQETGGIDTICKFTIKFTKNRRKGGDLRKMRKVKLIASAIGIAGLVIFSGIWIYRYNHSASWMTAQKVGLTYGKNHLLFTIPPTSISSQNHYRWNGIWLENYYFFETTDTSANLKKPPTDLSQGRMLPILELTVSGETGKVVAEDVSQRLKASYPIYGFHHH
jgi:hypothetical protein